MRDLHEVLGPELYEMHCKWVAWQVMPPVGEADRREIRQLARDWNAAVDGLDVPTPGMR